MNKSSHTRNHPFFLALIALFATVLLASCGGDDAGEDFSPPPDYAKELAGSPPPLKAIHSQADELLDGGKDAFDARIKELEGFPVVVNIWASWCGPCRAEFPHFQQASAKLGKEVAFLGVNSEDDNELAKNFLELAPVSYPSYVDPENDITDQLGPPVGLPATAFFDAEGKQTFLKQGVYSSLEDLEADIQTHAIDGGEG